MYSWICSEVVQAIDWAASSSTPWRARGCHWRAPWGQTHLHFSLPFKYQRTNLGSKHQHNHEVRQELKNPNIWVFSPTVFSRKLYLVSAPLLGNTDPSTHHLEPESAPYKVQSQPETPSGCSKSCREDALAILKSCSWSPTTGTRVFQGKSKTTSQNLVACL